MSWVAEFELDLSLQQELSALCRENNTYGGGDVKEGLVSVLLLASMLQSLSVPVPAPPLICCIAGANTQGQLGEKAAEFQKIFRDEVRPCFSTFADLLSVFVLYDECLMT